MKKFWMISMLLIAALFVISCGDGGEEEGGAGDACTEQGALRCSGDMVQKCDQEVWKNFENCADAGKTCNAGKCEAQGGDNTDTGNDNTDTGNDNTDTGSDNTDTGNDNTDTGSQGGDTCTDIYSCVNTCKSQDCLDACVAQGSATAQSQWNTMYNCWESKCTNADDFTSCVSENCAAETEACGLYVPKEGNADYPSPYGTMTVNLSSQYILTNESSLQQNMVTIGSFITAGNVGNTTLTPQAASSYYYTAMYTTQYGTMLQSAQSNVNGTSQADMVELEPVVIIVTMANASAGTALYDSFAEDGVGQIMVLSEGYTATDPETGKQYQDYGCCDAIGLAELTITDIVPQAGTAGSFAVSGNVDLYSPANYPDYGDITGLLGMPACAKK